MAINITFKELSLNDEPSLRRLVEQLNIEPTVHEPSTWHRDRFPRESALWDTNPFWTRYFYVGKSDTRIFRYWQNKTAEWLIIGSTQGLLQHITIMGLRSKRAEEELYKQIEHFKTSGAWPDGVRQTIGDLELIAERMMNPLSYDHQALFAEVLRNIRLYFKWDDQKVIESTEPTAPINTLPFSPFDKEVLREVYKRLVPFGGKIILTGDPPPPKRPVVKNLQSARKRVRDLSTEYANDGFKEWVECSLNTTTDKWSRPRLLYEHYASWVRKGGHGENRGEKAEAKATALSERMWGRQMRRSFPYRRDGRAGHYRVTLKRNA